MPLIIAVAAELSWAEEKIKPTGGTTMAVVSMKQLLEAGVHFGHQTRRWNPKMAPYIFTERNGIYIIDLQKTVKKLEEAYMFVRDLAAEGGNVLFVGTKKQAGDSVKEEALRAGAHYVNARWLGGMLTNFKTIQTRIKRLEQLHAMEEDGTFELLPKKEVVKLNLEIEKLEKYIEKIEQEGTVIDSVSGGNGGNQHFKIEGIPLPEYRHKKTLLYSRKTTLEILENELLEKTNEVEEFIANIKDSRIRRIINLRFLENQSWNKVADQIGGNNTEDSVRKAFDRFMKE